MKYTKNQNNLFLKLARNQSLFVDDISQHEEKITNIINQSSFLIIGGSGSIGSSLSFELFKRNPKTLHVVDISENNCVELVRYLRSSIGYIDGDFKTFSIDCSSKEFEFLIKSNTPYDYVFNLSALKHVSSESDPFTLMRMINVNIINNINTLRLINSNNSKLKKYFSVSSDKATNPVNMMGASKRIMEMFLLSESKSQKISMARFANVAFSDGSLLHGFNQRFEKKQPISAPFDIKRYFITHQESGELCLMSGLLGDNRDIFFPKLNDNLDLLSFSEIASWYLRERGFEPYECETEDESRSRAKELINKKKWPCYYFKSDTTGEKDFEEFYTNDQYLDMKTYGSIGIIKNQSNYNNSDLEKFMKEIKTIREKGEWSKENILNLFNFILNDFNHKETGKYLDQKM